MPSADLELPQIDGAYAWPGVDEGALEVVCSRIARYLTRAGTQVVAFLPVDRRIKLGGTGGPTLSPLLFHVANALTRFVAGEVAFIGAQRTWLLPAERTADPRAPRSRIREIRPRVLEIVPSVDRDGGDPADALQTALATLRRNVAYVLVDMGGYADSGVVPSGIGLVDGVVVVASRRRARRSAVARLVEQLPDGKSLGAILAG
jgi:hypothetical protein